VYASSLKIEDPLVGLAISGAKTGKEAKDGNVKKVSEEIGVVGKTLVVAGEELKKDKELLQVEINNYNELLKQYYEKHWTIYSYSNDPDLRKIDFSPILIENSKNAASVVNKLGALERESKSLDTMSSNLIKWGERISKVGDVAGYGIDLYDFFKSDKEFVDYMKIAKNSLVFATSVVPIGGQIVAAADLSTDLAASATNELIDANRNKSVRQADLFRDWQWDAYRNVKREIDKEAKKGIKLSKDQIAEIENKAAEELLNKLAKVKVEDHLFDGDVAIKNYETAKDFANQLKKGFKLELLEKKSEKYAKAYTAINEYNALLAKIKENGEKINLLISEAEKKEAEAMEKVIELNPMHTSDNTAKSNTGGGKPILGGGYGVIPSHTSDPPVSVPMHTSDNTAKSNTGGAEPGVGGDFPRGTPSSTDDRPDALLLNIGGGASTVLGGYDYVSWGKWSESDPFLAGGNNYWISGSALVPNRDLPSSGTATYNGIVLGTGTTDNGASTVALNGTSTLKVDFGTRAITGTLNIKNASNNTTWANASINANMRNTQKVFYGTVSSTGQSGLIEGAFYGTGAKEVGGNWTLSNGGSTKAEGIFAGKK